MIWRTFLLVLRQPTPCLWACWLSRSRGGGRRVREHVVVPAGHLPLRLLLPLLLREASHVLLVCYCCFPRFPVLGHLLVLLQEELVQMLFLQLLKLLLLGLCQGLPAELCLMWLYVLCLFRGCLSVCAFQFSH